MTKTVDVAVIGAGLAGLICAQRLQQAGYDVTVIEKSRGLGGRLATRRLNHADANPACADHGVRYLQAQGLLTQHLIQTLLQQDILQPWAETSYRVQSGNVYPDPQSRPCYAAASGITAVAKFLAAELEIIRGQRVQALTPTAQQWQLTLEATGTEPHPPLNARSVVVAIPAPQALLLLEPLLCQNLPDSLVQAIRSVEFDPCFSAIATYAPERQKELEALPWQAVSFVDSPELAWLSIESTKRAGAQLPILVAQSTATFARQHLEVESLQPVGIRLLEAAQTLLPWLNNPNDLQVHRWRYALVHQPLPELYLSTNQPLPLVCSGDWCGGKQIENALESGLAAACQISDLLNGSKTSSPNWETLFLELMHQLTVAIKRMP